METRSSLRAVLTHPKNPRGLYYRPGVAQVQRLLSLCGMEALDQKEDQKDSVDLILGCSQGSFAKLAKGMDKGERAILFAFSHGGFIEREKEGFTLTRMKAYRLATRVVCQTKAQMDAVLKEEPSLDNITISPLIIPHDLKEETQDQERGLALKALGLSRDVPTYLLIGNYSDREELENAIGLARIMPFAQFIFTGTNPKRKGSISRLDERFALTNLRFLQEMRTEFIPSIAWDIRAAIVLDDLLCYPFSIQDLIASGVPILSVKLKLLGGLLDPGVDYVPIDLETLKTYRLLNTGKFLGTIASAKKHLTELQERYDPKDAIR